MMDPVRKKAWTDALRSGEYQQCTGSLHNDNGFCCLGVLCDVSGLGEWKETSGSHGLRFNYSLDDGVPAPSLFPPPAVEAWIGIPPRLLTAGRRSVQGDDVFGKLSTMNDNGKTFADIADAIDALV